MRDLGALVAQRFGLGEPVRSLVPVEGGLLNRMWRLDTGAGSFAVKELNLDRDWPSDFDAVHALERAALDAGVAIPEPVPDPTTGQPLAAVDAPPVSVLVHLWVDGERLAPGPVAPAFARGVGTMLGRVHGLAVAWPPPRPPARMPGREVWDDLAQRAAAAGVPWTRALDDAVGSLDEVGELVSA